MANYAISLFLDKFLKKFHKNFRNDERVVHILNPLDHNEFIHIVFNEYNKTTTTLKVEKETFGTVDLVEMDSIHTCIELMEHLSYTVSSPSMKRTH